MSRKPVHLALEIADYNQVQGEPDRALCERLAQLIAQQLPEADGKIWHAHPVWFLDGNPVVGYSKLKDAVRLLFWSGADFDEPQLQAGTGKFRDASIRYRTIAELDAGLLCRWLEKARNIQWDYKNVVRRKGVLQRLK
jgi:hypothetical protein